MILNVKSGPLDSLRSTQIQNGYKIHLYTSVTPDVEVQKARIKSPAACLGNEIFAGDTDVIISDCMMAHATVGTGEWLAELSDGEAVVRLSHSYSCKVRG